MTQDAKLLTTSEVGLKLRVDPETIRRWCATGRIDAIPLPSGQWRIREDVVEAILSGAGSAASAA
jgi:predicted site-specific integrase-resolvase